MLQQLQEMDKIRSFFITEANNQRHVSITRNNFDHKDSFRHEKQTELVLWNVTSVLLLLLERI